MTIQCPECGARYRVDPSRVKKTVARVRCPKCNHQFQVDLGEAPVPEPQPAKESPEAAAPRQAASGPAILVVDDSKFFRELILDVLQPLGARLLTAADGVEALEIIRRDRPELVLLDLNLPRMDGYQLIREVRADASLQAIRLMAMSGVYRKEADVARVELAGANDFINKSFKPEQLQYRVKKLLEG
ncbi:hypothetical protein DESUT3_26220 [Desulfuromonas versatilis]|uniref:Response regulatory domain-containing protein n=1 Tax=Desulfuromonas versatilis TaxID=2802975 RepID=A0ABM8HY92_9BACT|nr:response regulator [Desulfuromonas versatilis]BCR05553.1 hypothetical protein DESUT3_26220 [Desulfuromonas versatilis]